MSLMVISFIVIGIALLLGVYAQARVGSAFKRYSQVRATSNLSGADVARRILSMARIEDVEVVETGGFLGDHYDPVHKRLCLSRDVYHLPSVASLGIAAHEVGHAIQHARGYGPLKLRSSIIPITQLASQVLPFVILGGFLFHAIQLTMLGAIAYGVLTVFQLITLPVEFDASRRAKLILGEMGFIQPGGEAAGVNRVLDAAALTYVAAFVAALGNLMYLLSFIFSNRE